MAHIEYYYPYGKMLPVFVILCSRFTEWKPNDPLTTFKRRRANACGYPMGITENEKRFYELFSTFFERINETACNRPTIIFLRPFGLDG